MEGEITIIAKFTRKDEQPGGPVLPVCHVTQVEGIDDANTAFMWMVGVSAPAPHYHLARMTVKDVRFLVANPTASVDIVSDAIAGHQHTLTIVLHEQTGTFIVTNITSGGNITHAATLLGIGDFTKASQEHRQEVIAGNYNANGEYRTTGFPSIIGMEFRDEQYTYRYMESSIWGTNAWCRFLNRGIPR